MYNMYEDSQAKINQCLDALGRVSDAAQEFIALHNKYSYEHIRDAELLKEKMKEKVVRVINEN